MSKQSGRSIAVALVLTASAFVAVPASAAIVANGSFENGFTGWTLGGTSTDPYPPVVIPYNSGAGYPGGAFGELIPPNGAPTNSPDPVGSYAAYFVADYANNQSISQTVNVAAGVYEIGFSAYAPANGFANGNDATFVGRIDGTPFVNLLVSSMTATLWQTLTSGPLNLAAGNHVIEFVFNTNGQPAKDLVIDQVYMQPVPLPAGAWLLLSGLVGFAALGRRKAVE